MNVIEALRVRQGLLSTKELCSLLNVSRNTIARWVRSNKLPAIRLGRSYRFDTTVTASWLESSQLGGW